MKITRIEKYKGNFFNIYLDGAYAATLSERIIFEFGLSEGAELSQEKFDEAVKTAQFYKARERAYYLLTYRDHSQKELAEKLRRNYPEGTVEKVILHLVDLGLLNDRAYAEKLARQYLVTKKYGSRRALFEMQRKGIEREMAKEALDELDIDSHEQILGLLERKYGRKLEEKNGYRKALSALMRQGFSYDESSDALREYIRQTEEER